MAAGDITEPAKPIRPLGTGRAERRAPVVERVPHDSDRRTTLARITPAGRQRLDEATAALEAVRFGMAELDSDTLIGVTETMAQVRASAGDDVDQTLPQRSGSSR